MPFLNIATTCPSTKVLGPGNRFVIWVQGCCFDCHNCGSPDWRILKDSTLVTPKDLSKEVLKSQGIEGITISGGEPMLQAGGLYELIRNVRSVRPLSVICFTGFTLEELKGKKDSTTDAFLSEIDVLIDGLYMDSLNDNKGLRGSSNQEIHFLSGIYKELADEFADRKRDIELYLFQKSYLMVGIKPRVMQFTK